jgi:hypothetical protein
MALRLSALLPLEIFRYSFLLQGEYTPGHDTTEKINCFLCSETNTVLAWKKEDFHHKFNPYFSNDNINFVLKLII